MNCDKLDRAQVSPWPLTLGYDLSMILCCFGIAAFLDPKVIQVKRKDSALMSPTSDLVVICQCRTLSVQEGKRWGGAHDWGLQFEAGADSVSSALCSPAPNLHSIIAPVLVFSVPLSNRRIWLDRSMRDQAVVCCYQWYGSYAPNVD